MESLKVCNYLQLYGAPLCSELAQPGGSLNGLNVVKDMTEAVKVKAGCHVTGMMGAGLLCKGEEAAHAGTATRPCGVIMMHEGPLHVYDMIASDLLAPRYN